MKAYLESISFEDMKHSKIDSFESAWNGPSTFFLCVSVLMMAEKAQDTTCKSESMSRANDSAAVILALWHERWLSQSMTNYRKKRKLTRISDETRKRSDR